MPPSSAERARAFVAGRLPPVEPRPASTVVLVRDAHAGLEVYVQQRVHGMAFAGGMVAFPGGSVDAADTAGHRDIDAATWARRLGTGEDAARGFVGAALRETREETGVALQPDDLVPWAHWITPRFERRRFDTWFFAAELPRGQEPQDVSGEAEAAMWVTAHEALRRADAGEWDMLPPTRVVLEELAGLSSATDIHATQREIAAVMPGWLDDGDAVIALLPDDPRYPGDDHAATTHHPMIMNDPRPESGGNRS
ncbi:NUDIX hydrolase [Actinobacteria bacterium YIM 96077]|uniref:NUDIX hydrolase n=1 Tax=Phytoactinopolyspora halophila TaxID=1981511 RepID=A0A329R0I5_9ACTN|nr:NUDIX hydrolase [Actinobacteria bacterium YIM 96077]RAW18140.1 NUDIX hydrolase [Phytoactinopolyspora halophila]